MVHYRSFCDEYGAVNSSLYVSETTWTHIEEILLVLEPCAKASTKLQRPDITLTDVYKIFNVCHLEVSEIGRYLPLYHLNYLPI